MILYSLSIIMIIVTLVFGIISFIGLCVDDFKNTFKNIVMIASIILLIMSIVGVVYSSRLNSVVEYHYTQNLISISESKNEMKKFLIEHPEYKERYEKENLE